MVSCQQPREGDQRLVQPAVDSHVSLTRLLYQVLQTVPFEQSKIPMSTFAMAVRPDSTFLTSSTLIVSLSFTALCIVR